MEAIWKKIQRQVEETWIFFMARKGKYIQVTVITIDAGDKI